MTWQSRPLLDRFNERVYMCPMSGCWLWTGVRNHSGYGMIRRTRLKLLSRAHRISWELFVGSVQDGMKVCHHCDVPSCVNPAHLFLGTTRDNALDMWRKGRGPDLRGEKSGSSKLTVADVVRIRELRSLGHRPKSIAMLFGVTTSTVSAVARRATWRNVP